MKTNILECTAGQDMDAWSQEIKLNPPPFICKGCGLMIIPTDFRQRKYCRNPKCQAKRSANNTVTANLRHPYIPKPKKPKKIKPEPILKPTRTPEEQIPWNSKSADKEAPLASINRGIRSGFKKYMEARPIYFQHSFPNQTIDEAWKEMGL